MRWVRLALVSLFALTSASLLVTKVRADDAAKPATSETMKASSATMKSPDEMAKEALAKWKTTLKLTDEQAPQFEQVMTDSYQKMKDAHTAAAGDKAKMKASMTQIMKDREDALAKVLTPEQMKIYREKVTKMAEHGKKQWSKAQKSMSSTAK